MQIFNTFFAYFLNMYLIAAREKFQILKNGLDYQGAWPPLNYTDSVAQVFAWIDKNICDSQTNNAYNVTNGWTNILNMCIVAHTIWCENDNSWIV